MSLLVNNGQKKPAKFAGQSGGLDCAGLFQIEHVAGRTAVMLVTGNANRLAVKGKQADDLIDVVRRQAGVGVEGKGVFLGKADNAATGEIVVVMRLEATLGWCGWRKVFVKIIMSAIADGVPIGFAIGKWHGVNQDVVADFEEDADFWHVSL